MTKHKSNWNILAKQDKEHPYLLSSFMATTLSKPKFEKLKELNPNILGEYTYFAFKDTDFTWWNYVTKKLTPSKIVRTSFDIDFWGNVREVG